MQIDHIFGSMLPGDSDMSSVTNAKAKAKGRPKSKPPALLLAKTPAHTTPVAMSEESGAQLVTKAKAKAKCKSTETQAKQKKKKVVTAQTNAQNSLKKRPAGQG